MAATNPGNHHFWKHYTSVGGEATTSQSVVLSHGSSSLDKADQALQVAIITEMSHVFLGDWREKPNDHLMLQIIFFRRIRTRYLIPIKEVTIRVDSTFHSVSLTSGCCRGLVSIKFVNNLFLKFNRGYFWVSFPMEEGLWF